MKHSLEANSSANLSPIFEKLIEKKPENRSEVALLWLGHAHKTMHAAKLRRLFVAVDVKNRLDLGSLNC